MTRRSVLAWAAALPAFAALGFRSLTARVAAATGGSIDVYRALGSPTLLAMGNRNESPDCLVEAAVNAALDKSFDDAEALLLARLGEVTLASLDADFQQRMRAAGCVDDAAHTHPPEPGKP